MQERKRDGGAMSHLAKYLRGRASHSPPAVSPRRLAASANAPPTEPESEERSSHSSTLVTHHNQRDNGIYLAYLRASD